jgi:hypothetical protein
MINQLLNFFQPLRLPLFLVKFLYDYSLYLYECEGEREESSIPALKTSESVVIKKNFLR